MNPLALIVAFVLLYLAIGLMAGAYGVLVRPGRLDGRLASAPFRVKLLLLPGLAVFWPLVISRAARRSA